MRRSPVSRFAPSGELYVLEERNRRVQVFDRDGRLVRSFGREGEGPGEFKRPVTLAITDAGEVVVWDLSRRRYIVFGLDGTVRREIIWSVWTGSGGGRLDAAQVRLIDNAVTFAEKVAVVQALRADANGRLWVQRAGAVAGEPGPIDLLDIDGNYLGTLDTTTMPDAFGPDRTVAWMERDEDTERVHVARLRADPR